MQERLLDVLNLSTNFHTDDGVVCAVNNLSFQVNKGESVCIVGESGCGKSVTSMSIMRLLKRVCISGRGEDARTSCGAIDGRDD